ncbi:2-dehydropantoate 2-reductase N-terminal domain-containing protein [Bosea sp. NBC_00550]|uniref:2-dehydropantoate 2-reductase N-terminal domain-containing protein n=1 Tax=Bosea sp. NBC_00550 TaxID=2969621 RepID=UPI002231F449|nr:2-dehydropantoate 2-reductase N-terminal domain-containing protein [Bosea sp. NBC_00550]UZF94554.1 hypothetical protein NWE53_10440 [Bosea sp. NBC_00550]
MARICIYGAGLVGCYLGGRLLAAGGDIRFIGRPAIGDVLRRDGLTVSHYDGRSWHVPPEAIVFGTDAAIAKDCDLVLATVKSGGTAIAARDLAATSRQAGRRRSTGSTARSSGRPGTLGQAAPVNARLCDLVHAAEMENPRPSWTADALFGELRRAAAVRQRGARGGLPGPPR